MAPKRGTSSAAGRPSKAAKKDTTAAACKLIADALELARKKGVPADVTTFLGAALKHTLPTYKEARHKFQASVLSMVATTLADSESVLLEDIASAEATVNGGGDETSRREAAVVSAEQNLQVCQETLQEKQTLKAQTLEKLKATLEPLKEAQAKQQDGDAKGDDLEKAKEAFAAARSELLMPMKEAGGSKRPLHNLAKQLKAVHIEDSLLEAMELPLLKKPEQRGDFDAVILEQLDLQLSEKDLAFESKLKEAASAKEERAAAVRAAQDAHDTAKEASEAAAEELKAAKDAESAAKASSVEAHRAAKSLTSELADAAQQLDTARQRLEAFRSGPLVCFNELLERSAPLPEQEREEPPAETPDAPAAESGAAAPDVTDSKA
eukprot:TRINITY_DN2384_c0_g1_i3.p1 TRINITY_DN2384_c0_g1~~TRINITY_DN2384_c0_g1_i3.p1  ORF type:complete len:380 (+),score=139.76 TRINITY_DN2384_c0_g1_i3:84-1223(+)